MNSKEKLIESFFNLLSVKDFNSISISELCKVANVHRSTFYSYFDNLYELLEEAKNYAVNYFMQGFDKSIKDDEDYLTFDILVQYLSFIKDNKNLYIAYFTNSQILSSDKSLDEIFKYIIMPISKKRGAKDQRKVVYTALFYIGGITNIIKHWLDNGFKESVEYIASIIVDVRNSNKDI